MSGAQSEGQEDSQRKIVDPHTIEMLVCPLTKTLLVISKDSSELISRGARVAFPIRKGVPLLCLDEARTLSDEEIDQLNAGKSL